eukprot:TRINITY_DN16303_c0_g1_i1.p1 TRINITY_DN16303_c0_g1~~TRINITY_DN16303_c0_g1_i1.p1  ORF type:complete len:210 (+),score=44.75 TRINITY_DN16303_c0_g1_i1:61-690(+)
MTPGTRSKRPQSGSDGNHLQGTNDLFEHPTISRETMNTAKTLFDSYEPVPEKGLTIAKLRSALKDVGFDYTYNQVRDLVYNIKQTQGIEKRNQQIDFQLSGGLTPRSQMTCAGDDGGSAEVFVNLRYFIEILSLPLNDESPENELRAAWECMDVDGDGVLSASDFDAVLRDLHLPKLRPEELIETLVQADFDCDGVVKFDDFLKTMDSN